MFSESTVVACASTRRGFALRATVAVSLWILGMENSAVAEPAPAAARLFRLAWRHWHHLRHAFA